MGTPARYAAWTSLVAAILLAACDTSQLKAPDAGVGASCLEAPNALARPPALGLPCELIPPGLTLAR